MYGLLGVANTDPDTLFRQLPSWMDEAGHDPVLYKPTLLPNTPWQLPLKGVVGIPSVALFQQRFEHLVDAKITVFLFDSAPLLEFIPSLQILDLAHKHVSFQYRFKPIDPRDVVEYLVAARTKREHIEVGMSDIDLIPTLLNQTQSSLLAPMLTYLYAIPVADRPAARSRFYKWLTLDKSVDELMQRLPKNKHAANLKEWLNSETGTSTHDAVRTLWQSKQQGKAANVAKTAKQFNLAEYDLKYLMIALNKEQLTQLTPQGTKLETIHNEDQ